jgi:hypothetical protein
MHGKERPGIELNLKPSLLKSEKKKSVLLHPRLLGLWNFCIFWYFDVKKRQTTNDISQNNCLKLCIIGANKPPLITEIPSPQETPHQTIVCSLSSILL